MATDVQSFIVSAMRIFAGIDSGGSPSINELNDGMTTLNQLVANWSAAGVPIYQMSKDSVSATGQATFTMGPGGTLGQVRPVKIISAQCTSTGVSFPTAVVGVAQWTMPKDRTATSKFAQELFWDAAYPSGTVSLWPTPAAGTTIEVFSLKPLTAITSLGQTLDFPPGYEHALRFALAQAMAPEFGATLSPDAAASAAEAKAAIANMNVQVLAQPMGAPAAVAG